MLGLCSITFRDQSPEKIIRLVKETDLEVIEWGSDSHVPEDDAENAKKIAKMMKKEDLQTNSYGTYYKLGSFEYFEPYIEIAQILGASIIRVWAGETGSAEIDMKTHEQIITDAQRIGELAGAQKIKVGIEYHQKTLTDTPDSAELLMHEINSPFVLLYWQPAENLSVKERIESLPKLTPWIKNVHVFHWENYYKRFPLEDGFDEWKQYINTIVKESPHEQDFLLEFVPDDDPQTFFKSAETLKKFFIKK